MLYRLLTTLFLFFLKITSIFSSKSRYFLDTRKNIYSSVKKSLSKKDQVIWFHCASLGEFEQARPLIEKSKSIYIDHKILLTFFSPSGYEIQKKYELADCICYLPFDTPKNINLFINQFNLKVLFLIKYEFWPELLNQLYLRKIKIYSISSVFRKEQLFFKFYGVFFRKILKKIDHFFLQDDYSSDLLNSIGIYNTSIIGDTRIDRVLKIKELDLTFEEISNFKNSNKCLVLGSTWDEDYEILLNKIHLFPNLKIIIAPHKIDLISIKKLIDRLTMPYAKLSSYNASNDKEKSILIIDSIGILSKVYSYADIAYVGGGMGTKGLHNTMEPAVFQIPIIIGKNYRNFNEVKELVLLGGILSVRNNEEFNKTIDLLLNNSSKRKALGKINYDYVWSKAGASLKIFNKLKI